MTAFADPPHATTTTTARSLRARWAERTAAWSPTTRGMLWTVAAGFLFSLLNALARVLAQDVPSTQAQFLRYATGLALLLPWVLVRGFGHFRPASIAGQWWRGAVHTAGLALWFLALPRIPLADMTAIGFTTPIFVMIGARVFFGEPMHWERWLATGLGFAGVMMVVGPRMSFSGGWWHLVMLSSAPLFAASFLITKALTRHDGAGTILLWQSITVTVFTLPMALLAWQPLGGWQWLGFMACGVLGSAGHYCLTRSFAAADISATQSAKFLDLLWSAAFGFMIFADVPTRTTLLGGAVIATATLWVARREARAKRAAATVRAPAADAA